MLKRKRADSGTHEYNGCEKRMNQSSLDGIIVRVGETAKRRRVEKDTVQEGPSPPSPSLHSQQANTMALCDDNQQPSTAKAKGDGVDMVVYDNELTADMAGDLMHTSTADWSDMEIEYHLPPLNHGGSGGEEAIDQNNTSMGKAQGLTRDEDDSVSAFSTGIDANNAEVERELSRVFKKDDFLRLKIVSLSVFVL